MKRLIFLVFSLAGFNLLAQNINPVKAEIEPNIFHIYERVNFVVKIYPNRILQREDKIESQLPNSFSNDLVSPSKVKKWQTTNPDTAHYISVSCTNHPDVEFELTLRKREFVGGYDVFTRHGVCLTIVVKEGRIPEDGVIEIDYKNTTTPWLANQISGATDHEGLVYIAINGEEINEFPKFTVKSGQEKYRRVIVPSSVRPGEQFKVKLISLDKYNNLTETKHKNVELKLNNTILKSGISYKGRGKVTISLPTQGVYRIEADGILSNPVKVCDHPNGPYWGDIHFHNYPSVDAMGNTPYIYAKDVSCLDFAGATEHGAGGVPRHWEQTLKWVQENNKPQEFVTLLALESGMGFMAKGRPHVNLYHYTDHAKLLYGTENGNTDTDKASFLKYLNDYKVIAQTHHTGWGFDMRMKYPDELKLIEIYSMHGQSELFDNETPLSLGHQRHRQGGKKGPYYARDAWALGKKWYCMGSSDNHFGQPGVRYNSVSGVYANQLTRVDILDAFNTGQCYATTGERIIFDMKVNNKKMGSVLKPPQNGKLKFEVEVYGTDIIESVELFACPFIEGDQSVQFGEFMFKDDDPLVEKTLNSWYTAYEKRNIGKLDVKLEFEIENKSEQMVYYLRVIQKNPIALPCELEGSGVLQVRPVVAWSTPVWIKK